MASPSDTELLEAARRGDPEAIEALLVRHQERIYRFGMRLCRDPDDAKDVLQETLIAMARSVRDFGGRSSLSTWLYAVARSFCVKKRRRSKFAPLHEEPLEAVAAQELEDDRPGPDEIASSKEVAEAVTEAIRSLEPAHRDVLVLRDIEGLKATEAAEVLEISVAAVKSRLHRARLQVREALASVLGTATSPAPAAGCPDVVALYSKHLEGEISGEVCAQMERHLAGCEHCRGTCASLRQTLSLCRSSQSVPVPKATQDSVRTALHRFVHRESPSA